MMTSIVLSRESSVGEWMRDPQWSDSFHAVMDEAGMSRERLSSLTALSLHQLIVLSQGRMSTPLVEWFLAEIDSRQRAHARFMLRPSELPALP
ncbi:hypothetical protein [Microbacterium sp. Leaf179]|uniref:hypothetical protein n=1 Tax=Microbacterium sp. Leaf179 TaxID=1736288 RepID=UPI0012E3928B|nr:hypothetical protein [Microbacterium sp. Leaf179]